MGHAKIHASEYDNTWQTLKRLNPHIKIILYKKKVRNPQRQIQIGECQMLNQFSITLCLLLLLFTSLQPALIYGETGSVDELVAAADTPFAIAKSVFCVWRELS